METDIHDAYARLLEARECLRAVEASERRTILSRQADTRLIERSRTLIAESRRILDGD